MCEIGGDDHADAWEDRVLTARKVHVCDGCGSRIAPGEKYLRFWSVTDGNHCSEKGCAACWFTRQAFGEAHSFYVVPSYLHDSLRDCIDEDDDEGWRIALAALLRRKRRAAREARP